MWARQALGSRRLSIIICTDGRAQALDTTLRSLLYLEGPAFEVCVVRGPTEDGTAEVLDRWADRIKVAKNPERNLSVSRNIGIAMAAGDIVAFVDDDGLPEAEWQQQILRAFDNPDAAAAGGLVMDHTGASVQYYSASADRLGNGDWQRKTPATEFNFPLSFNFPYVQGTNSAFRKDALIEIGGFDEEFEFYLDETDVCCRLVDAGWCVEQLPNAVVHHKFLPSAIRTSDRVTRVLYPVLKNKLYFSLINNRGHYRTQRAIDDMIAFVHDHERNLRSHLDAGRLSPEDLDAFHRDVDRAWEVGLERGLSRSRRLLQTATLERYAEAFREFPRPTPEGKQERFLLISQEYPPGRMGGIGRYIHQLARAMADMGHHVHVLTAGEGHDRVDFEDGVWVHRMLPRPAQWRPPVPVPHHIWNHAATMLETARDIAGRHDITAVYAPIWDCEGAAVLFDGVFPLVTALQTNLHFWLDTHQHKADDKSFQRDFAQPMLNLESVLLQKSELFHAISQAIARDTSDAYHVDLDSARTVVQPLGLEDWSKLPATPPASLPDGSLRLLFVGRLETRKGIDVLLAALPRLLARYPGLHVDIVGNDRISGPGGISYRAAFEAENSAEVLNRVQFHGEATELQLRGLYRSCDVFVAPSRFESFGLILVEAMMFAKPVVSCRAGGIVEVVEEGRTGLLAEPGDVESLAVCLESLLDDPDLRRRLGDAGRQRYEAHFSSSAMAVGVVDLLRRVRDQRTVAALATAI